MLDDRGGEPLSPFGRPFPPSFECRVVTVEPGCARVYDDAEWRDAIVVVESGAIELEDVSGRRWSFACGDLLWLVDMPLRALRNDGREPAVLVAVARAGGSPARDA